MSEEKKSLNPYEWEIKNDVDREYYEDTTADTRLYDKGLLALEDGNYYISLSYFLMSKDLELHYKTFERIYEVLKLLDREVEGIIYLKQAYALKPSNNKTATMYAKMLVNQGNNKEALKVIEAVLNRNSTYGPAKKLLSLIKE